MPKYAVAFRGVGSVVVEAPSAELAEAAVKAGDVDLEFCPEVEIDYVEEIDADQEAL